MHNNLENSTSEKLTILTSNKDCLYQDIIIELNTLCEFIKLEKDAIKDALNSESVSEIKYLALLTDIISTNQSYKKNITDLIESYL